MKKTTLRLKSIAKEAAACRAAFKGVVPGALTLHCHHNKLVEQLTEKAENRIVYILTHKEKSEQALRLHLFRPLTSEQNILYNDAVDQAQKEYIYAVGPAQKVYDDAVGPKWKVFNDAVGPALKVYDDSVGQAWKMYNDAVSQARKVYNKAIGPSLKVYNKAMTAAHRKLCVPGCPWNGRTIL